jgi:hypothetical protein
MLRLKYKLFNGRQPQDAIKLAVPAIQNSDMYMGQWPSGGWLYGEIDTDSGNQGTLEAALANWSGTFISDEDATAYIDTVLPANTVVRTKLTANAASIVNGHVVKTYTES